MVPRPLKSAPNAPSRFVNVSVYAGTGIPPPVPKMRPLIVAMPFPETVPVPSAPKL
jgi:hypothetical protein